MTTNKISDKSTRIAVIGAGASGLTAAYTLKKLGYDNVKVFEKDDRPGGKVYSYEYEGTYHELGAVWFGSQYKTILKFADELNVPYFSANGPDVIYNNEHYTYSKYILSNFKILKLIGSLLNLWKVQRKFPEIKKAGFADVHPDLHIPLSEFSQKYNIHDIAEIVASFVTGCGYGYYGEVPAMYLLKIIPELINGKLRGIFNPRVIDMSCFTNGWQSLWQAVADKVDVKYNAGVTGIKRYNKNEEFFVDIETDGMSETFDRVIVSAPLDSAHKFMQLSSVEEKLFGKIKNYDYVVTLFKGDNIPNVSLIDSTTVDTMGKVTFMVHHRVDTNVHSAYQLLPEGISEEETVSIIKKTVEEMGGTFHEVVYRKYWNYFPHVSKEDLDNGFYKDLESLQGVDGTYYVGGLLNFETVEDVSKYAKELVEKVFGG